MNDKLNALDKLIEAVEVGTADHSNFAAMFPYPICDHAREAHNGSLDAALALHEALLPGWRWDLDAACNAGVWNSCDLLPAITGEANTPARAWLLAILRAYRSMEA